MKFFLIHDLMVRSLVYFLDPFCISLDFVNNRKQIQPQVILWVKLKDFFYVILVLEIVSFLLLNNFQSTQFYNLDSKMEIEFWFAGSLILVAGGRSRIQKKSLKLAHIVCPSKGGERGSEVLLLHLMLCETDLCGI